MVLGNDIIGNQNDMVGARDDRLGARDVPEPCHPERSEGSDFCTIAGKKQIPRCARNDMVGGRDDMLVLGMTGLVPGSGFGYASFVKIP